MTNSIVQLFLIVGGLFEFLYRIMFAALCVVFVYPVITETVSLENVMRPYLWKLLPYRDSVKRPLP